MVALTQPSDLTATISYGGTAAKYALPVHERHASKSKFLEEPARDAEKTLLTRIRREMEKAVR